MKERMYAISNERLEELAYLRMADQAVELATAKINMVGAKTMSLGDSLPMEQQEAFKNELAILEEKKRRSRAGLVGRLRHEGIITSEMISATGRVNIGETNGDSRMQYVEGYQYSPRTIKRWEKARVNEPVLAEVAVAVIVEDPVRRAIDVKLAECVPSDEIKYLTRGQKLLRTIKRNFRDEVKYPIIDTIGTVGRWFRGERKDGRRVHHRSLLKRVKGYFEPSLESFGRVFFSNFMERQEMKKLFGSSQQASPLITDEGKLNPNPTLIPSFSTKGGSASG
ncbi:MAG: hypothetical protein WC596_00045 [Candidatus Shapirobacteria bacterium]